MSRRTRFWDRIAKNYDNQVKGNEQNRQMVATTKKYLSPDDVILDYGCGTGSLTVEFAEAVHRIHAIDFSSKMIERAESDLQARQIENIRYTQATIFDAGFEHETFDAILAFNILHLLEGPNQAVDKIRDLLKPGGLFISSTACLGENLAVFSIALRLLSKLGLVPTLNTFTTAAVEDLIENRQFQLVETARFNRAEASLFIVAKKA